MGISVLQLAGHDRLDALSTILRRARQQHQTSGIWDAADLQWWWRKPRRSDDLATSVYFDAVGPVAAGWLTSSEDLWQVDCVSVGAEVDRATLLNDALQVVDQHGVPVEMLVEAEDRSLWAVAIAAGFTPGAAPSGGTAWCDLHQPIRPTVPEGFHLVDRKQASGPHPMVERNGAAVEDRLKTTALYDPSFDLSLVDAHDNLAGYALFWFDPITRLGLLEPLRILDAFQRRGLASVLINEGLRRLRHAGATRCKVGFVDEHARRLYRSCGFVQTSVDYQLLRDRGTAPRLVDS